MFHERYDKREVYQRFRDSPPEEGQVLVACGMYEGIDLPEDLGRFQVIAKIPWPNLGNNAVRYQADRDSEWYLWEAAKITIQAAGRICRTPQDYGETFILDSSFQRLVRESRECGLLPNWYIDGIEEGEKLL